LRRKLVRPLQMSCKGSIEIPTRPQRLKKTIQMKRRQSYPKCLFLFSKSVLQNLTFSPSSPPMKDPESSAYSDQFIMPPNTIATPYSTYQSFAEFPYLSAQDQEKHLSSSSHQDQHHQTMPLQYTAMRERYNSHGSEISQHVPCGSLVLPEPSLSGPVVRNGEAAGMICCINCRAVLEVFGQCQNPCSSATIEVLRLNDTGLYPPRMIF